MYETQKGFDFVSILETLFGFRKILSKKIPERTTIILKAIWDGTKPFLGFRFRSKKSFVLHLFFQCTTCQNHIFVKLNSHIVIIYLRWNNVNDNNNLEPIKKQVTLVCRLAQLFLVEGLFLDARFLIHYCVYMFISNVNYILLHKQQQIFITNVR